jgi:hypothetical protein
MENLYLHERKWNSVRNILSCVGTLESIEIHLVVSEMRDMDGQKNFI